MGNQVTVGWVSSGSLDENKIVDAWVSSHTRMYWSFEDHEMRVGEKHSHKTREALFQAEIKNHLHHSAQRRILAYQNGNVFGYTIIEDHGDYLQIHGVAVNSIRYARTILKSLGDFLTTEYPDGEFRGMVRCMNKHGQWFAKYFGVEVCDDWHDQRYDEHHIPLRIKSSRTALEKCDSLKF